MKLKKCVLLLLLAVLLLTGCSKKITVDADNGTISDGEYTYTYTETTKTNEIGTFRTITITYPNGAQYYWRDNQYNSGPSSLTWDHTDNYDPVEYIDGNLLMEALTDPQEQEDEFQFQPGLFFVGLLFLGVGIWHMCTPYTIWWMEHGWVYKNAEPSDRAIGVIMAGGIILSVFGVILVIVSFFG